MRDLNGFFSDEMKRNRHGVGLTLIAVSCWLNPATGWTAVSDLPEHSAYVEMLRADRMRNADDPAGARIAYRAAQELLEALNQEQPGYKSSTLQYRIAYCREQIAALPADGLVGMPATRSSDGGEVAKVNPPVAEIPEESSPLQGRLDAMKQSFQSLEQDRDRMADEMKRSLLERDEAVQLLEEARKAQMREKAQTEAQSTQILELEHRVEDLERIEKEFITLRKKMETLQERLAASEEENVRWKSEAETSWTEDRERLESEARRRTEELEQVRKELESNQRELAIVRQTPIVLPPPPAGEAEEIVSAVQPVGDVVLTRIESQIEAGQLDEAAVDCRAILEKDRKHVGASYGLARIAWKKGDAREALRAAVRLSDAAPDRGEIQFFCGEVFQGARDLRRALSCYEAAVRCQPSEATYRRVLAESYYEAGRLEDAVAAFRSVAGLHPQDGSAYFNLAALLVKLDQPGLLDEARSSYWKAIELGEASNAILDKKLGVYLRE